MNCSKGRRYAALWSIAQGAVAALVPQVSIALIKKLIGTNFENAGELEARPAYVRQLRAVGVGMVAAGAVTLLLEPDEEADDADDDVEVETVQVGESGTDGDDSTDDGAGEDDA
ncbi:hypothetical protein [Halostella salina]|uniref:hypothetical protein n=1 Tax=Halostella salina TaxID=1547897 RepID=UPI000EF8144A|nr:hypothetical protein [Halostella salina]